MPDYQSVIVTNVQCSVEAMNAIILALQRDHPLSSDILDMNYSAETVERFYTSSQAVVQGLEAASLTAANWLQETGECLSRNISEAGVVESSIRDTTASLAEADAHTHSTQSRVAVLEGTIQADEANLASARSALWRAEDRLDDQRTARNIMRGASVLTFFFAPVISFTLAAIDIVALERAVDNCKHTVSTIQSQLDSSRSQLQAQRDSLAKERNESARLSATISELTARGNHLAAEKQRLESARCDLSTLSQCINDCLHAVNASVGSSKSIPAMSSMSNVVSGIQGIVGALGANVMFEGPLAQLDDAALGALDRRVAAIKCRRMVV